MTLSIEHLKNNTIYNEEEGTLGERIDFAWLTYTKKITDNTVKEAALKFLIYAFDLRDTQHINAQLIELMDERKFYLTKNSEYIPNKAPKNLPFHPGNTVLSKSKKSGEFRDKMIKEAILDQELLDVRQKSKIYDNTKLTKQFNANERAKYRVHIQGGLFKKNNINFDTLTMTAHDKEGFAAFTLNANGELSIFNHLNVKDQIAHSSMNAGAPVVAAGELQIVDGKLHAINTYSGHYQPTLFTVYRALEYFDQHRVDISNTLVLTDTHLASEFKGIKSSYISHNEWGINISITPASEIYKTINEIIHDNVMSINSDIKSYQQGSFAHSLYQLKDRLIGSDLTAKRIELATKFEAEIAQFKQSLNNLNSSELHEKIKELDSLISKYETENARLSKQYNKNEHSGRLATKFGVFKDQLFDLISGETEHMKLDPNKMKSLY